MVPRRPAQHLRERTNGFLLASSALLLVATAIAVIGGVPWPVAVVLVITAAAWIGRNDFPQLANMVKGAVGEEEVARILAPLEGDGFRVLHDIDTGRGNIDHVAIGPTGVFVIETKAWTRTVYLQRGPRLMCGGRDQEGTIRQVLAQVFEVKGRLSLADVDCWVHGVVALTATSLPRGPIERRSVHVSEAADLPAFIRAQRQRLDRVEVARATAAVLRGTDPVVVRPISLDAPG